MYAILKIYYRKLSSSNTQCHLIVADINSNRAYLMYKRKAKLLFKFDLSQI